LISLKLLEQIALSHIERAIELIEAILDLIHFRIRVCYILISTTLLDKIDHFNHLIMEIGEGKRLKRKTTYIVYYTCSDLETARHIVSVVAKRVGISGSIKREDM